VENLFKNVPIYEDDVILNLNFAITYKGQKNITNFENVLFKESLAREFKNCTLKNCIRMKEILIDDETICFIIKQISPDIALQQIVDDIDAKLNELLSLYNVKLKNNDWDIIELESIGDPVEVGKEIDDYLNRLQGDGYSDDYEKEEQEPDRG